MNSFQSIVQVLSSSTSLTFQKSEGFSTCMWTNQF